MTSHRYNHAPSMRSFHETCLAMEIVHTLSTIYEKPAPTRRAETTTTTTITTTNPKTQGHEKTQRREHEDATICIHLRIDPCLLRLVCSSTWLGSSCFRLVVVACWLFRMNVYDQLFRVWLHIRCLPSMKKPQPRRRHYLLLSFSLSHPAGFEVDRLAPS
jgi:hypothetical protein